MGISIFIYREGWNIYLNGFSFGEWKKKKKINKWLMNSSLDEVLYPWEV